MQQEKNFTFHNVSINTVMTQSALDQYAPLHSTMFLLIQYVIKLLERVVKLYIPQCFY